MIRDRFHRKALEDQAAFYQMMRDIIDGDAPYQICYVVHAQGYAGQCAHDFFLKMEEALMFPKMVNRYRVEVCEGAHRIQFVSHPESLFGLPGMALYVEEALKELAPGWWSRDNPLTNLLNGANFRHARNCLPY